MTSGAVHEFQCVISTRISVAGHGFMDTDASVAVIMVIDKN